MPFAQVGQQVFWRTTWKAGEGNRTLVSSLEGYSFTIKLHPRTRLSWRDLSSLPSSFWNFASLAQQACSANYQDENLAGSFAHFHFLPNECCTQRSHHHAWRKNRRDAAQRIAVEITTR